MRLFEEKNGKINIYSVTPNYPKVTKFKRQQMRTIPEDQIFVRAETNNSRLSIHCDSLINTIQGLVYKDPNKAYGYLYHIIGQSNLSDEEKSILLERYITTHAFDGGIYMPHKIFPTYNEETRKKIDNIDILTEEDKKIIQNIQYFLCIQSYYEQEKNTKRSYMDLLNLPEPLYVYHLLLKEQYDVAEKYDMDEQASLFIPKQDPFQSFDIEELKEFDRALIRAGVSNPESHYSRLSKKAKQSEKVLTKIREANNL